MTTRDAWPPLEDPNVLTLDQIAERDIIGLQASLGTFIVKSADETINTSTALQDDDELLFAMRPDERWVFSLMVFFVGTANGDFKFVIKGPSGFVTRYSWESTFSTTDTVSSFTVRDETDTGLPIGAATTRRHVFIDGLIVNGSTAGDCVFRWAENTAIGDLTVEQYSYLVAQRIF